MGAKTKCKKIEHWCDIDVTWAGRNLGEMRGKCYMGVSDVTFEGLNGRGVPCLWAFWRVLQQLRRVGPAAVV